jgi:hypothetical protein
LIIQFACAKPNDRAEEFQRHLVNQRVIHTAVRLEIQGNEAWLNFPTIQSDVINRIIEEGKSWCLDRGLGLMQNSGEPGSSEHAVLMIADLAQMVG